MIDKISKKILVLLSNDKKTEEEKEILLFGITRIVEDIPKTIGIILIGLLLGIIKEMLVVTIVMALYKSFAGGVHAKSNIGCFIYSLAFYLIIIYMSKYLVFTGINKYGVYTLMYIFAIYVTYVYIPADVPEIPKVNVKLRKEMKLKAIISLNLMYVITILVIQDVLVQNLIIYTIFLINVMTTRTIYNLFKAEYGFETYIPDELI